MLKLAIEQDLDQIEQIFIGAKKRMKNDDLEQWNDSDDYPNREIAVEDIKKKQMYKYEVDGKVAGVIVINDVFYDSYPETPCENKSRAIHRVAVADEYIGTGIGTKLYTYIEDVVKSLGYKTIIVDTYSKNKKMCNLIEKCGYQTVGEFQLYEELPNWIMFKKEIDN